MAIYQETNKSKLPKNGNSWYYRCYYTDIYGNRKQKESKKFSTKKSAQEAEREFLNNIQQSDSYYDNLNIGFINLYNSWWEVKKNKLKETNAKNLKPTLDKHILSFFEPFKLDKINMQVINEYLNFMKNNNLAISYKNSIINYCKECFLYGVIYFGFDNRIANHLTKFRNDSPKDKKKDSEVNFWTTEEFNKFINVVDNDYYKLIFIFLYRTGLRIGEFRALQWNDLNIEDSTISISKEVNRNIIAKPKTKNSIRIVDIDKNLLELLLKYKKDEERTYGFENNWYMFGELKPAGNNTIRRYLNKYIELAGVKHITIHGFRHSHVSLLINLGCDSRDVAERVGDTIQTIESTYYHIFPKKKKETVNKLNDLKI